MMRAIGLAAALLVSAPVHGQTLTDGTTDGTPTSRVVHNGYSSQFIQTFAAAGSQLASLSIWFYGGTYATANMEQHATSFRVWEGWDAWPAASYLYREALPQTGHGRVDIVFADPLQLLIGGHYSFSVLSTNCGPVSLNGCYGPNALQPGATNALPSLELTTADAYAGGEYWFNYGPRDTGRDFRFVATYIPEPRTLLVAVFGVMGLIAAHRRANRSAR